MWPSRLQLDTKSYEECYCREKEDICHTKHRPGYERSSLKII